MIYRLVLLIGVIGFGLAKGSLCAQKTVPIIKASSQSVSMRIGNDFYPGRWGVDATVKPDVYEAWVPRGKTLRVAFVSEKDSLVWTLRGGEIIDFIILTPKGDSALTRIKSTAFDEPAVFTKQYVQTHTGKTFVEIPEVYELINVVFALTEAGRKSPDLINKQTPYYQELLRYFEPYRSERIVSVMDSVLKQDESQYFPLKMDAYAFSMDANGNILQSSVYDRVSWGYLNTVRPYIPLLQQFAKRSSFVQFYRQQRPFYKQLITSYQDSLGVAGMQSWLNRNFPATTYQSFKIVFSPLVSGNQSANWFENNGFKEAQAHVNYPFVSGKDTSVTSSAVNIRRGNIVFTELNHAFINPEADKHSNQLKAAITNLDMWLADGKPAKRSYNDIYSCFNEYMNWGLVCLRYVDMVPKEDLPVLQKNVENMMVNYRGFKKFAEFDQFLVPLYRDRPSGKTLAGLYPQIIQWFASQTEKKQ